MYTIQQPENLFCSFELINRIIVVMAELNGFTRNFLLDTGAPDIILNKKHIKQHKLFNNDLTFNSVTGSGIAELTLLRNFEWESISIKNKKTVVMDFEHLEKILKITIHGLIGYKVIRDYALFIDYRNKQLNFWTSIKNSGYSVIDSQDFIMHKHIPIIEAKIGTLKFKMGLDSGAGCNILDVKYQKKVNKYFNLINDATILGGKNSAMQIEFYNLNEFKINNFSYKNSRFILTKSISTKRDGLLGFQFLKTRQVAINYPKNKIEFIRKKPTTK